MSVCVCVCLCAGCVCGHLIQPCHCTQPAATCLLRSGFERVFVSSGNCCPTGLVSNCLADALLCLRLLWRRVWEILGDVVSQRGEGRLGLGLGLRLCMRACVCVCVCMVNPVCDNISCNSVPANDAKINDPNATAAQPPAACLLRSGFERVFVSGGNCCQTGLGTNCLADAMLCLRLLWRCVWEIMGAVVSQRGACRGLPS